MLSPLPSSWSQLTWEQLVCVWSVKQRYGGNADVARVAAFLSLSLGQEFKVKDAGLNEETGEKIFLLEPEEGDAYTVTARELSWTAKQAMPWVDYPYGDPGEPAVKDKKGKVIKEAREPVRGYVSPMRDAMPLPKEVVKIYGRHFALPQVACSNLTWQQYRALQALAPQLFAEGIDEDTAISLQAQFLAHVLTPRSIAMLDTFGGSIRLRPHYEYLYNAEQAEHIASFFLKKMKKEGGKKSAKKQLSISTLFHIIFQVYQTALTYYSQAFPLLFAGDSKADPMRDALQGEVGTINTIMKYAGYAEQQQVYDSHLPFVLDILNTMTKEAKEIEKMNAKIRRK